MVQNIEALYIGAATNRNPHAADIESTSSVVCFASKQLLGLWDVLDNGDRGVSATLNGHQAEINCVKFIDGRRIASGDQAGVLQIRSKIADKWKVVCSEQAHEPMKPISALAAFEEHIVTGASDSNVKIWKVEESDTEEVTLKHIQTLSLKGKYPLDIQLASFPGTPCLIVGVASTSKDFEVWSGTAETKFVHSATLSGHEDWIKSLAFVHSNYSPPQVTIASGSQDGTIRLWKIEATTVPRVSKSTDDIFDAFESSLGEFAEGEEGGRQMSTKRHMIAIKSSSGALYHFSLTFDALLVGHDAGVTSLSWMPTKSSSRNGLTLLSTSVDSSVILWSSVDIPNIPNGAPNNSSSIWINQQRFGDVGGQRFGGFVGGLWAAEGKEVLAWGWSGGWRRWQCLSTLGDPRGAWQEKGAITGHQGSVESVSWESNGDYLLSTGLDQTSRIYGPCRQQDSNPNTSEVWHELARPQVHGYDIIDAEFITPLRFISIADEKIARVFDAPRTFVATLNNLGTLKEPKNAESRPAAANVAPLGLSNKAVDGQAAAEFNLPSEERRPFEGELAAITLWPEIEKIFGHGYELISLATSHSGEFFATACKSTSVDHAVIRVYNTRNWQLIGEPLSGHKLTVTRITFSPDDKLILSVSRDRTWRLFKKDKQNVAYLPLTAITKAHERIIWDCAWVKETSSLMFATAARDKTVKIWQPTDEKLADWKGTATLTFKEAATAVDFTPVLADGRRRLAIGLEGGDLLIYSQDASKQDAWRLDLTFEKELSHVANVNRVSWRPSKGRGPEQCLSSCSEDGTIRITKVHLGFH